jgi:hypothetical protein
MEFPGASGGSNAATRAKRTAEFAGFEFKGTKVPGGGSVLHGRYVGTE